MITESVIKKIAPTANKAFLKPMVAAMADVLPAYGINTPLRVAHFLAQAAHETDGFKTLEEYWGPTLAQKGYQGRKDLGNLQPGDGKRFMGRGIFQLTGRSNYRTIGAKLGLPLEDKPELAADPHNAVVIACEYWKSRKISPLADKDDIVGVTKKINGGRNGLEDRRRYLSRAKDALRKPVAPLLGPEAPEPAPEREAAVVAPNAAETAISSSSPRDRIRHLQKLLNERNYDAGKEDGIWGSLTRSAVLALQGNNNLPLDGESVLLSDVKAAPRWVVESRQDATVKDLRKDGSKTIKTADVVQKVGGTAAGGAVVVKAGSDSGLFDTIGGWAEKAGTVKGWFEPFADIGVWITSNFWWGVALVGGAGALGLGWWMKNKRLREYKDAVRK